MRHLLMLAAVAGLATARPEVYREKEDFQFSRSSTDEGSKSGYYGAQRGNMGGNYERAHNMDPLAQNQMSGLVRTVEGELGDGAKHQTGSVYTSANSRGMYGSGNYDLSNLAGRNFQESDSHSSLSHSSASNHGSAYKGQLSEFDQSRYGTKYGNSQAQTSSYRQASDSRNGGYNAAGNSAQISHSGHGSSSIQSESEYEDRSLAQNSGYSQSAGYQGQDYDQGRSVSHTSNGYGSNIHSRLVSGTPVRIVIRPGTKVVLPVAAQTYDASQSSSAFDQNVINSETEVFNGNDQHELLKPKNKHYESSYSYRKEWEKQDARPAVGVVPLSIPSQNPYPGNSELYTETQAQTLERQRQSESRIASQNYQSQSHSGLNVNSASSSQTSQSDHNRHSSDANSGYTPYNGGYKGARNGAYNAGARTANDRKAELGSYIGTANGLNQIEDSNTRPKAYQSSYSYHKSWEHQGDPYVIKPATNGVYNDGQASGKLTAESLNQEAYGSHQYGSHHQTHHGYSSHSNDDCDEQGHVRVARSPGSHYHHQAQNRGDDMGQDLGQQTEQQWDNIDELSQQTQSQWNNLEGLGQQAQNNWDQVGQQTENKWDQVSQQTENKWDKLRDEGQQAQTLWGQQEPQSEWGKLDDFGQHAQQNQWDQQNVGQQTQNTWDTQELEPQRQTDLGQQNQDTPIMTTMDNKPSGPDSSRQDNHSMDMDHQSNENTLIAQQNNQKLNTESHTLDLDTGANQSSSHHAHTIWDEIKREEIGQENEDSVESKLTQAAELGQQVQVTWGNINQNQDSFNSWHQKTEDKSALDLTNSEKNNTLINKPNPHPWMYNQHQDNRSYSNQYFSHNSTSNSFSESNSHTWQEHSTNLNNNSFNAHAQTQSTGSKFGSSVMSLWDKLENIEKQTILSHGTEDKVNQNVEHQGIANIFGIPTQPNVFDGYTTAKPRQLITTSSTTTTPSNVDKVLPHDIGRGDIEPEVLSNSHDVGRGDIEPEYSSNEENKPVDLKPYKTSKEIETLSITKEADTVDKHDVAQSNSNTDNDKDLSVMSLDQQNHSGSQDKKEQFMKQSGDTVTTAVNNTQCNYHHITHKEDKHHMNDENENRNTEQQDENFDQQSLHQQTLYPHFVDYQENEHHANTDQKLFDFGQQNENVGPEQIEQQFEAQNIGQSESFQQENQKREAEELSQRNEQFDQVSLSGWKPDDNESQQEHNLQNWAQEHLEQLSQSVGHVENMNQQVQSAWKPTEDLQQHSELSDTFGPPMEDLSQQVQPAWKPTEELQKHSELSKPVALPIEDLNQQVQTAWMPSEDLQQQSQITDTFSPQINQNEELPSTLQKKPDIVEELIAPKKATVVDSPPEATVTEKPGFWKSVGSKFTSAKDKVSSWFSS